MFPNAKDLDKNEFDSKNKRCILLLISFDAV
jgi:hypothetical protein